MFSKLEREDLAIMNEENLDAHLNWKDLQVLSFPKWYQEEIHETKCEKIRNRILGKRTRYEDYYISQLSICLYGFGGGPSNTHSRIFRHNQ